MGDPSARVFEVYLIVLDGVQGGTLLGGGNPARATTLTVSQSFHEPGRISDLAKALLDNLINRLQLMVDGGAPEENSRSFLSEQNYLFNSMAMSLLGAPLKIGVVYSTKILCSTSPLAPLPPQTVTH